MKRVHLKGCTSKVQTNFLYNKESSLKEEHLMVLAQLDKGLSNYWHGINILESIALGKQSNE